MFKDGNEKIIVIMMYDLRGGENVKTTVSLMLMIFKVNLKVLFLLIALLLYCFAWAIIVAHIAREFSYLETQKLLLSSFSSFV